jgi:23S rRNA (adenine2030-N6)-methyltransferase
MFSYRHHYHAGNFADVFKHVILVELIRSLQLKDKPFCVLDTHAGSGRYDLHADPARRTGEFSGGIGRLWGQAGLSSELESYLNLVRTLNGSGTLRWYPGSPRLIRTLLRPSDRLLVSELHNRDFPVLKAEFAADRQVAVHQLDGYQALKAFLPPRERRGLVFLDPPYEDKDEFKRLSAALSLVHRRWPGGIVAIWYPILIRAVSLRFHSALKALGIPRILCAELGLYPYDVPMGMRGCGMILVNPPWRLDHTLYRLLPELLHRLNGDAQGETQLTWLVAE